MSVNFDILNQKGSPAIYSDVFANRPTASYAGRLFISTDTKEIYRDTGSAWEEIAGQGSGNIQGSGTANYVPKFTDTETIGNSQIRDDGTGVGIGVVPSAVYKLDISGSQRNTLTAAGGLSIIQSGVLEASYGVYNSSSGAAFLFEKFDDATATFTDSGIYALGGFYTKVSDGSSNFYNSFFSNGNVAFGSVTDAGYKLDVNGTGRFSGALSGTSATFTTASNDQLVINSTNSTGAKEQDIRFTNQSVNKALIRNVAGGNIFDFYSYEYGIYPLRIESTGVATFSSSVTATSFIPSGATVPTNGMYLSAANTLNFATNTTNRLSISSAGAATFSGQLNISYVSFPEQRITDSTIGYQMYASTGSGEFVYGTYTNHSLVSRTNGIERARITNGGNVLIGTTTDAGYLLDVNGTVRFSGALTGTSATFSSSVDAVGRFGATTNQISPTDGSAYFYKSSAGAVVSGYQFIAETGSSASRATRLTIDNTGAATFSSTLGINGVSDNVKSGTYTPTLDGATNVTSSSASICQYLQVGNTVTVSGRITITATSASTLTAIRLSLPLTSGAFTSTDQCGGTGYFQNGSAYATSKFSVAAISLYTVNMIYYSGASTPLSEFYFSFTYQII